MRVLLAVDQNVQSAQISQALTSDGFTIEMAADGPLALLLSRATAFDAVILDASLPRIDGLGVLDSLRDEGIEIPVIFLASDAAVQSRIAALDAGADDCLPQEFEVDELRARLRARMRSETAQVAKHYKSGKIAFDSRTNRVLREGATVTLTVHEMAVLSYLFHNSDRLVSRSELTAHIYQEVSQRGSNTIAVFVNRLRRKLGGELIETVRGRGYVIKASH